MGDFFNIVWIDLFDSKIISMKIKHFNIELSKINQEIDVFKVKIGVEF